MNLGFPARDARDWQGTKWLLAGLGSLFLAGCSVPSETGSAISPVTTAATTHEFDVPA